MLKVSIITVCYNSSKTIEKAFQSILSQSYENIELIVIDGLSFDGTLEIIKRYESCITKYISEPDKGLYDAMNKGVALATGDIVGVLNSDDMFYDNNVISNVVEFHENNIGIEASVGNVTQINEKGKVVRNYSATNWNPEKLKIGFMPPHPSIFVKKCLFDKYGNYHLDFISGADYELIVRFFLKNQISWKFSGITTTSMLIGGISSSGFSSYRLISKEIGKALLRNDITFYPIKIYLRVFWKLKGFLNRF